MATLAELKETTNASLEAERERCLLAQEKVARLRATVARLKEKNQTLRGKYHVLLDMYNELAEEVRDGSDSSSSSDSDSDEECVIM